MKKISKKAISVIIVLMLTLSTFAVALTANAVNLPPSVTVNIHKYTVPQTENDKDPLASIDSEQGGEALPNQGYAIGTEAQKKLDSIKATPVQGAEFTFYYVGDLDTAIKETDLGNDPVKNGLVTDGPDVIEKNGGLKTGYTLANGKSFPKKTGLSEDAEHVITKPTGTNGVATFTFDESGSTPALPYGLYYVVETKVPSYVKSDGHSAPFYIYVPMTDRRTYDEEATDVTLPTDAVQGETYMKTVDVYPKNVFTTNAAAAYKTIDQVAYITTLADMRIRSGAVIELHREDEGYKPADDTTEASGESVVASFTLASTNNGAVYTSVSEDDTWDAKDENQVGYNADAKAPTKLQFAKVSLMDSGKKLTKYADNGTGKTETDITGADDAAKQQSIKDTAQYQAKITYADVLATYVPETDDAAKAALVKKFGQEYSELTAIITNDGRMIVNGLPVGKYHWHEKTFTGLYAQKANPDGSGFVNDYTYVRGCQALDTEENIIGDHNKITITDETTFGSYEINTSGSAILNNSYYFNVTGKVVTDAAGKLSEKAADAQNHIENTIGVQIEKETIKQDDVLRNSKYVSNNDAGVTDLYNNADHYDYSVGQIIPYRLAIKIPADMDNNASKDQPLVITDTMDKGLTLIEEQAFTSVYIPKWEDGVMNDYGVGVDPKRYSTFGFMVGLANKNDASIIQNEKLNITKAVKDIIIPNVTQPSESDQNTVVAFTVSSTNKKNLLDAIHTALKAANLYQDSATGTDYGSYILYIYYEAKLNEKAVISDGMNSGAIKTNNNTLSLTSGTVLDTRDDKVSVFTGGAKLKKVDSSTKTTNELSSATKAIPGAKYKVYRATRTGEAGNYTYKKMTNAEAGLVEADTPTASQDAPALKFSLYTAEELAKLNPAAVTGEITDAETQQGRYILLGNQSQAVSTDTGVIDELTTIGANAILDVSGLAFGSYIVEEVYSPTGYELNHNQYGFDVTSNSYKDTVNTYLPDVPETDLPLTGGIGTIIFTVVGLALIGGAAFFFIRSRRNKEDEA